MVLPKLRPVAGYNGYYTVCEKGVVYSEERLIELPNGRNRRVEERELVQKKNKHGYKTVVLCIDGKKKTEYVHRLVAQAYINNAGNLPYINHKSGNPANNGVDNLEWVTHRQNVQHAYNVGLNSNQGGTHGFAVGIIDNEIGQRFETVKEWAAVRGINYSTARNFLNGYTSISGINLKMIEKIPNKKH